MKNLLFLLFLFGLKTAFTQSQTITIYPTKDNTLFAPDPQGNENSNGKGEHLFAGYAGGVVDYGPRRALVVYDIAAELPPNVLITDARFDFYVDKKNNSEVYAYQLNRMLADWGEGTSKVMSGAGGQGVPPEGEDATWSLRFFNDPMSNWTTAGGDFESVSSGSVNIGAVPSGGDFYTIKNSEQLIADVQSMLDNGNNFGWMLRGTDETTVQATAIRLRSSETPASVSNQPRLTVTYTARPLAAAFGNFRATLIEDQVHLSTRVIPFQKIEIQHSTDGLRYQSLGQWHEKTAQSAYFIHKNPAFGTHYYRLKNGTTNAFSKILSVEIKPAIEFKQLGTLIQLVHETEETLEILLFDTSGRLLLSQKSQDSPFNMNLPTGSKGIFFLQVNAKNWTKQFRFYK